MGMSKYDWRCRANAIRHLGECLQSSENLALVQPYLDSLLRTLLSAEKNVEVVEEKRRIIMNLISRIPLDNLENRAGQLIIGLCRQGGPGSNRVAKALMQRLPPTAVVHRLMSDEFLKVRSSKFRENALQMVLFALMTFPSTYFDLSLCARRAVQAVLDRKRRVRQASLDVLAVLGQITSVKALMDVVQEVAEKIDDRDQLVAATKARLSRKQLPIVTSDGNVQYALKIPSPESNGSSYIFGSDVEWIMAGVGSVSPTSLRRQSFRKQHTSGSDDSNRTTTEMVTKRSSSRPPHEILAVGVGVKPARDINCNGTASDGIESMEFPKYQGNGIGNTNFIIATAIPTTTTTTDLPLNPYGGVKQMKLQSRSYPDLFKSTSKKQPMPYFMDDGHKPSRLPITSRFPAMEISTEGKTRSMGNSLNGRTNLARNHLNNSFPRNLNRSNSNGLHSQETLIYQSSPEESQSILSYDSSPPMMDQKNRRFTNVTKYINPQQKNQEESLEMLKRQKMRQEIQPPVHNRNSRSASLNRSNENISIQSNDQSELSNNNGNDNLSSEDCTSSTTTTSTRVLDAIDQIIETKIEENQYQQTDLQPRSMRSAKERVKENDQVPPRPLSLKEAVSVGNLDAQSLSKEINGSREEISLAEAYVSHIPRLRTQSISSINKTSVKNRVEAVASLAIQSYDSNEELNKFNTNISCLNDINRTDRQSTTTAMEVESEYILNDSNPIEKSEEALGNVHAISRSKSVKSSRSSVSSRSSRESVKNASIEIKRTEFSSPPTRKIEKPKDSLNCCLSQLESPTWEHTMSGLQSFLRLIRQYPDYVDSHVHVFSILLCKHIKNLRSQVSRNSCQAANEFFITHGRLLEFEAEELATSLLNRTADTNKFLRRDATKALETMCDHLTISKVTQIITTRGANHQNAIVRTAAAKLCNRIVERIGCDKIYSAINRDIRDKIILTGAKMLMEGSLETRNHAKVLFKQLSINSSYNKILLDVIPPRTYRNIEKTLKSIK